jgi:hypothetical protein
MLYRILENTARRFGKENGENTEESVAIFLKNLPEG